ncbi:phosphoribosylanthranilate isomerase [Dehalobacter restrictus]|uniref:N-(5'-phosphoribosyl)anthranilate isomerase n=1 Tax=Dehalobacter restrictus (strain DSM 9455 / PER-K23) TaxID=871738 RepID=A0ABM5P608_DEHRP|nr:phosphoribosylanthranilate isomerase [Dehalobacter restrictus]AHF09862.1 N-(5'-phosphoribosyl)anthranilate isomerase [Dehalobacter restrictus DSM 9455]
MARMEENVKGIYAGQTPKVKICGIRTLEDVRIINELKPDFAGFVLAPSKRQVSLSELKILIASLDKKIIPVGVFVNQDPDLLLRVVEAGLQILQIHGDEPLEYMRQLKNKILEKYQDHRQVMIWKVVRVGPAANPIVFDASAFQGLVDGFVYDKYDPETYGGTGESFDWKLLQRNQSSQIEKNKVGDIPMILAGGLNEENVASAITLLHPYCLDVSSSVETEGRKDPDKMKRFINRVRA